MKIASRQKAEWPPTVTFRPNERTAKIIQEWDKTGFDRTLLINAGLSKFERQGMDELKRQLESVGLSPKRSFPAPDFQLVRIQFQNPLAA